MKQWTSGILVVLAGTLAAAAGCQGPAGPAGPAGSLVDANVGPVPVAVAAGNVHTCAIISDGTVWCWGSNASNQLAVGGDGGLTHGQSVLAPEKVALDASAVAIAVGGEHGYQNTPVT